MARTLDRGMGKDYQQRHFDTSPIDPLDPILRPTKTCQS